MAWVHSHVDGNKCFFSSLDCHTQRSIQCQIPDALGIVIEIDENKNLIQSDYYQLTTFGMNYVERCRNTSEQLHTRCNRKDLYVSKKPLIQFVEKKPLQISNFSGISVTPDKTTKSPSIKRKGQSTSNIKKAKLDQNSETLRKTKTNEKCKGCKKEFTIKKLLKHIENDAKCKSNYTNKEKDDIEILIRQYDSEMTKLRKKRYRDNNKLKISKANESYREANKLKISKAKKSYREANKLKISKAKESYRKANKQKISIEKKNYYQKNKPKELKRNKDNYAEKKFRLDNNHEEMLKTFFKLTQYGPIFPCISCNRRLLKRTVMEVDKKFSSFVSENNLLKYVKMDPEFEVFDKKFICRTCRNHLLKKKIPPLNFSNGLEVDQTPKAMEELSIVGKSMIQLDLPFLKLRKLPKTRMPVTNDRVINVPLTLEDIGKTVSSLPRTADELGFINVRLKRRLGYASHHRFEKVKASVINKSLKYLKKNNTLYKNINLKFLDETEEFVDIDSSIEESNPSSSSSENSSEKQSRSSASSESSNYSNQDMDQSNTSDASMTSVQSLR